MKNEKIQSEIKDMQLAVRNMAPLRILCQSVCAVVVPGMVACGFMFGASGNAVSFAGAWAACLLAGVLASYEYTRTFTTPLALPRTSLAAFILSTGWPGLAYLLLAALDAVVGYSIAQCSVSGSWAVALSALGAACGMFTAAAAWFIPRKCSRETICLLKDWVDFRKERAE